MAALVNAESVGVKFDIKTDILDLIQNTIIMINQKFHLISPSFSGSVGLENWQLYTSNIGQNWIPKLNPKYGPGAILKLSYF